MVMEIYNLCLCSFCLVMRYFFFGSDRAVHSQRLNFPYFPFLTDGAMSSSYV